MRALDYLMVCMMEEAAEVQKVASKIYRFGQHDIEPGKEDFNVTVLSQEIGDFLGVVDFAEASGLKLQWDVIETHRKRKPDRILEFINREKKD